MLHGKKILLGVSGSIAAYKSVFLVRLLIKSGAEVQVIMTASASDFISSLTLSTLSNKPVYSEFVKEDYGQWNNHVELALWANHIIIAPASANTIAKMASGLCDNLLTAIYLSAKCPVSIAPAMDLDMYRHATTVENLNKLRSFGNHIIDAEYGELASGLIGNGRMAEPEHIVEHLINFIRQSGRLIGKKVLITAGPTYESLDPVRFIGNHSTGKMGYEIAKKIAETGAEVTLVSGPTSLPKPEGSKFIPVTNASEMYAKSIEYFPDADIIILAAAVADYAPKTKSDVKIKKKDNELTLDLVKTVDIAAELGKKKTKNQLMIGFALETDNEVENAVKKLQSKNLDLIILNSLKEKGAGFGHQTNKITVIKKDNSMTSFPLKSKTEVASDIVQIIVECLNS